MRGIRIIVIALAVVAGWVVPARAASSVDVRLAAAVATGDAYVGWRVDVEQAGFFDVRAAGVNHGLTFWYIGLDDRAGGSSAGGDVSLAGASAGGVVVTTPAPNASTGSGAHLEPGGYLVLVAAPGRVTSTVVTLIGPSTATIEGAVRGRALGFTSADFARGATFIGAPSSIHGSVTVQARQSLFAVFAGCFGGSTTIAGPEASPWVTPTSASYGSPGTWTFGLDFDASPEAPTCEASLTVLDLPL